MKMSYPLYLASKSPRRKLLLKEAGVRFKVYTPRQAEKAAPSTRRRLSARAIVKEISRAKAIAALSELREKGIMRALVLSADTLVFNNNQVLGKPNSINAARKMLSALSGKWHEVYTGVTLLQFEGNSIKESSFQVRTKVRFFRLKQERIEWYLDTGEPMDKAGAYGIQGPGASLVEKIDGSYTNVVGLPLGETIAALKMVGHR
jgi:septum formation protein